MFLWGTVIAVSAGADWIKIQKSVLTDTSDSTLFCLETIKAQAGITLKLHLTSAFSWRRQSEHLSGNALFDNLRI